ncbi:hypothetical protein H3005_06020 [Stenotrophomonas sp. Br8]|uniref:hypothetical protein n=1 Tax=Stenotrophomonas sp. Br8 TaxID=2759658 RepID=UPI00168A90F5|nr:hypothetical protein [Stenotrophomonas sp. Br8]
MPINRAALIACLSLLAACSPQAADNGAGGATPEAVAVDPVGATAPAAASPAALQEPAEEPSATSLPSSYEELEQARAAAGCAVSNDVYDIEDIRIYCQMPDDVQAFLARENTCQHFAGEEPYDDERRRELEEASATYCEGREKIFADLVARHQNDCAIRKALIGINGRYDLAFELDIKPCEG